MGLLIENIRKASEGFPYKAEYGERVGIDEDRVRRAREIQSKTKEGGLDPTLACIEIARNKIYISKLIRNIELILIREGQHDPQFKLGDLIKYTPHEVANILKKYADELLI